MKQFMNSFHRPFIYSFICVFVNYNILSSIHLSIDAFVGLFRASLCVSLHTPTVLTLASPNKKHLNFRRIY